MRLLSWLWTSILFMGVAYEGEEDGGGAVSGGGTNEVSGGDGAGGGRSDNGGDDGGDGDGKAGDRGAAGGEGGEGGDPAPDDGGLAGAAAAIAAGLKGETQEEKPAVGATKTDGAVDKTDKAAPAPADGKTPEQKAEEEKKALLAKKADDFLPPEAERSRMHPKTQGRLHELHRFAKAKEEEAATLTQQVGVLSRGRDGMLSLLKENHTEPEELGALLNFNRMIKQGGQENLEQALKLVEEYRKGLYVALGREAPGVDLIDEFPDLKQQLEANDISRATALELAQARRKEKVNQSASERQRTEAERAKEAETAAQTALQSVTEWCGEMAAKDLNYKAKEAKVLPEIDAIIKEYPPNLWLPTIKRLYAAVNVETPRPNPLGGGKPPLRPGGPRPGNRQPNDALEALKMGLGYSL